MTADYDLLCKKTLLRADEVARMFDVSIRTVYRLCENVTLRSIRVQNALRIRSESVKSLLDSSD
jgi:excisionase family DNA binding protein